MKKRRQGGSELAFKKQGRMIVQRREFANYLRKNSGVKDQGLQAPGYGSPVFASYAVAGCSLLRPKQRPLLRKSF